MTRTNAVQVPVWRVQICLALCCFFAARWTISAAKLQWIADIHIKLLLPGQTKLLTLPPHSPNLCSCFSFCLEHSFLKVACQNILFPSVSTQGPPHPCFSGLLVLLTLRPQLYYWQLFLVSNIGIHWVPGLSLANFLFCVQGLVLSQCLLKGGVNYRIRISEWMTQ